MLDKCQNVWYEGEVYSNLTKSMEDIEKESLRHTVTRSINEYDQYIFSK